MTTCAGAIPLLVDLMRSPNEVSCQAAASALSNVAANCEETQASKQTWLLVMLFLVTTFHEGTLSSYTCSTAASREETRASND
jgi:hypothetical protein